MPNADIKTILTWLRPVLTMDLGEAYAWSGEKEAQVPSLLLAGEDLSLRLPLPRCARCTPGCSGVAPALCLGPDVLPQPEESSPARVLPKPLHFQERF